MKLIIGLGNPEPRYDNTRHNVGFMLIDHIAEQLGASWQSKPKFRGDIAETAIGDEKVILFKPSTYYNLSGEAARAVVDFYKLETRDILVIHDELDLPFGMLRTRLGGSDAGNNGVKSLTLHLGTQFARVRVGIANELSQQQNTVDFVLGKLTNDERRQVPAIAERVEQFIEEFVRSDKTFEPTSHRIQKDQPG